jgi:hypothetical protein
MVEKKGAKMSSQLEWRKDQKKLTRDILERVDVVAFSFDMSGVNKGCTLNHLNGKYGYISLEDALANNWRVFDYETDELLGTYDSIEAVIEGGWKVST